MEKIEVSQLTWQEGKVKGFSGKDLLKLNKGSCKLVKAEPLATYPEHLHPDKTEYAFVLEGTPEFVIGNRNFTSKSGDFFVFPKGVRHAIYNNTRADCLLLIGAIEDVNE